MRRTDDTRTPRARLRARIAGAVAAVLAVAAPAAHADLALQPGFNDEVTAVSAPDASGNRYVSGWFTAYNQYVTGGFASVQPVTGALSLTFPRVTGSVFAIEPDGAGGAYLGGNFTCLGPNTSGGCSGPDDHVRANLAHVDATGAVTAWAPTADGAVNNIITVGSTLFVGGEFSTINGLSRSRLAALTTGGAVASWTTAAVPAPGRIVDMTADPGGDVLYASTDTTGTYGLFGISTTTGATVWNPGVNSIIWRVGVQGSRLYAGGFFTTIDGASRGRGASWDITTPAAPVLTGWDPGADGAVRGMAFGTDRMYLTGGFTCLNTGTAPDTCLDGGEQPRRYAAAYDTSNPAAPTLLSWNPQPDAMPWEVLASGSTVYLTGPFRCINTGGQACGTPGVPDRLNAAAVDATTGVATLWAPNLSDRGSVLARPGTSVMVGGSFTHAGGAPRNGLAAIGAGGSLTGWAPYADQAAQTLVVSGSSVYAGGDFQRINGQAQRGLAQLATADGALQTWPATVNGTVYDLTVDGSTVRVVGDFACAGGDADSTCGEAGEATRNGAAAFDRTTGLPTSWDPDLRGDGYAITIDGSTAFVGGSFDQVNGGTVRNNAAAISTVTGMAEAWNPDVNSFVSAIALHQGRAYLGGWFTQVGGTGRNRLAAVDTTTGTLTGWNPDANAGVEDVRIAGGRAWVGGYFSTINGGTARPWAAALSLATGTAEAWNPGLNGGVNVLRVEAGKAFLGGRFTTAGGTAAARYAQPDVAAVPSAPAGVAVTPADGAAIVAFAAAGDGGWAIENHEYSTDGGITWAPFSPAAVTGPVAIGGLTNGVTYNVGLRAINGVGAGPASSPMAVTPVAPGTPPGPAPTTPPPPSETTSAAELVGPATVTVPAGGPPQITATVRLNVTGRIGLSFTGSPGVVLTQAAGTVLDGWSLTEPATTNHVDNWTAGRTIRVRILFARGAVAAGTTVGLTATAERAPVATPPATLRGVRVSAAGRGRTRVMARIRVDHAGTYAFVITGTRTSTVLPRLPGGQLGNRPLPAGTRQATERNTRAGREVTLTAYLRGATVRRPGDVAVWAVLRTPSGEASRVRLGPGGG